MAQRSPHLLPLSPSPHSSYSGFLAAPQTHPACSGLHSYYSLYPKLFFQMSHDSPLTSSRSDIKCHVREDFLNNPPFHLTPTPDLALLLFIQNEVTPAIPHTVMSLSFYSRVEYRSTMTRSLSVLFTETFQAQRAMLSMQEALKK